MTQWKKAVRAEGKVEEQMPECFALLSRNAFAAHRTTSSLRGESEAVVFARLFGNVGRQIGYAFATKNTTDKRLYLYSAVANIMLMLSLIEGKSHIHPPKPKGTEHGN